MQKYMALPAEKMIDHYSFNSQAKLGEGSFSKVYLGKNEENGQPVAVKVVNFTTVMNDYILSLLKNEILVMKKLVHPNIVQLYEVCITNNNIYIMTEFCNEGDLSGYLKSKKSLTENEAIRIMGDIVNGFKEMCKHGAIHRDMKPANVFIHNGTFKLGDFGFAKGFTSYEQAMSVSLVGTPMYMSPQCLQRQSYTSKNDIWSIGVIFYEMLVGKTPWPAMNHLELLHSITKRKVVFPPNVQVSKLSKEFIIKALQVKEEHRWSWAEIFSHPLFQKNEGTAVKRRETNQGVSYSNQEKPKLINEKGYAGQKFNATHKNQPAPGGNPQKTPPPQNGPSYPNYPQNGPSYPKQQYHQPESTPKNHGNNYRKPAATYQGPSYNNNNGKNQQTNVSNPQKHSHKDDFVQMNVPFKQFQPKPPQKPVNDKENKIPPAAAHDIPDRKRRHTVMYKNERERGISVHTTKPKPDWLQKLESDSRVLYATCSVIRYTLHLLRDPVGMAPLLQEKVMFMLAKNLAASMKQLSAFVEKHKVGIPDGKYPKIFSQICDKVEKKLEIDESYFFDCLSKVESEEALLIEFKEESILGKHFHNSYSDRVGLGLDTAEFLKQAIRSVVHILNSNESDEYLHRNERILFLAASLLDCFSLCKNFGSSVDELTKEYYKLNFEKLILLGKTREKTKGTDTMKEISGIEVVREGNGAYLGRVCLGRELGRGGRHNDSAASWLGKGIRLRSSNE